MLALSGAQIFPKVAQKFPQQSNFKDRVFHFCPKVTFWFGYFGYKNFKKSPNLVTLL